MPHIDINDLHKERDKRSSVRNEIYDRVLIRCHSKIKSISKLSDICCCFFEVPSYMYGLPAYNQIECIYYIIQILIDDGFKVEYAEPNILFIAWYDKPKKTSLADIANRTKMPIDAGQGIKRTTQNYNVNNSLYHDGLSELEVKSNQIFKDEIYNPRKQQNNSFNKLNINRNSQNRNNENRNSQNQNSSFIDFNPTKKTSMSINNEFKTIATNSNIKTFSMDSEPNIRRDNRNDNRNQIKTDGFRSLYDDSGKDSSYKKMKHDFKSVSLDDIDEQFGLGQDRNINPIPQLNNNFGFSDF